MKSDKRYLLLKVFLLFCAVVLASGLSGCSQPLRTLMALGSEQDGQKRYVESQRQRFKVVLRHARQNRIKYGTARSVVIRRYGEPVLENEGTCLYRDPVDFLHSPKVYMTFDEKQNLLEIRIEPKDAS